jgi:hypothetical protein
LVEEELIFPPPSLTLLGKKSISIKQWDKVGFASPLVKNVVSFS